MPWSAGGNLSLARREFAAWITCGSWPRRLRSPRAASEVFGSWSARRGAEVMMPRSTQNRSRLMGGAPLRGDMAAIRAESLEPGTCCPTQGSERWFVNCDQWLVGRDESARDFLITRQY